MHDERRKKEHTLTRRVEEFRILGFVVESASTLREENKKRFFFSFSEPALPLGKVYETEHEFRMCV